MSRSRLTRIAGLALMAGTLGWAAQGLAQDLPCAPGQMRCTTHAQRLAAAKNAAEYRKHAPLPRAPLPGGQPEYFGIYPNWAWTPQIDKFIDTLPGLGGSGIPVGVPDTTTFPATVTAPAAD